MGRGKPLADLVVVRHLACQVTVQPLHDSWRITELAEIRLLVYTTSVGLQPSDPLFFDYASLSAAIVVCDLVHNPPEFPLLRAARANGCTAGNGPPMLVHQRALAFERWTSKPAPVQAMREDLGIVDGEFFLDKQGRTANMVICADVNGVTLH
ncbi:MAG: hypothetical protein ACHQ7N_15130 [Candidatus Methylomirabilales bacterium]